MVIWGAIWGAILGWLWPGQGFFGDLAVIVGALLGACAGLTLRHVVRREITVRQAEGNSAQAPGSADTDTDARASAQSAARDAQVLAHSAAMATASAARSDAQAPAVAEPSADRGDSPR